MKKNLLIISTLFLGAFAGNAQITITSTDISVPPKMIQQAHDTIPGTITAGSAGILQTWNMTALGTDMLDTLNFIVPTWSSYSTNFPTSNLGLYFMGQNAYGFTINNSTSLSLLGNATN